MLYAEIIPNNLVLLLLFVHIVTVPLRCCCFGNMEQCFPSSFSFLEENLWGRAGWSKLHLLHPAMYLQHAALCHLAVLPPLQRYGPGAVFFFAWRWCCLLLALSASSAPCTASDLTLGAQQKQAGCTLGNAVFPGVSSVASVGASEPFPEVKCWNGSTASGAAVGCSQRPYSCHISLSSGRLGFLSRAVSPPSWALLPW